MKTARLWTLALSLGLLACGGGSARIDAGSDDGGGGDDDAPLSCQASCSTGCCDGDSCVTPPTATACGTGGASCIDCTADSRADSCSEAGDCVCAATGARCTADEMCLSTGCSDCTPDCAGKCAGADDGCEGSCPNNDCAGCCDADRSCVAAAAQNDLICGAGGEQCQVCTYAGRTCDGSAHVCVSTRGNDAAVVAVAVPAVMSPSQTANVTVTMRNIGTNTWTAAGNYKLGAQNPQDNGTWGVGRVELAGGDSIAPGDQKSFTFQITAPAGPGIYSFQWRMLVETVEWFGEYSTYRPVVVGGGSVAVCEAARALADTDSDAAPTIQGCISAAPAGGVVELPAGIYRIDSKLQITAAPITLRTEGKGPAMPPCTPAAHDCAELRASTAFADTAGILQVMAAGSVVDHLVINGNKTARAGTASGSQCGAGSNTYGYNMRLACSNCTLMNSVTQNALCGTGCEVSGAGSGVIVWRNTIAGNGVHDHSGMWADGVTVHDYAGSTFAANQFADNTDVDFIFGGCQNCYIQGNSLHHTAAFASGSFAALMLHAWPSGATSGDFTGTDTSFNRIDCGTSRRCGFGLYLGPDAWYDADTYGGAVHHNVVQRAEQGVLIDDVHDMRVWNNYVADPASSTDASCGTRSTNAYAIGNSSANVDTSEETMDASYTSVNWDGCIPNWWQ